MSEIDTKYASSGVGTAGLTTGIIGTSLAGLMALGGSSGNGLLGGLFGNGGNSRYTDDLRAEIASLQAEKYTNAVALDTYKLAREHDNKLSDAISGIKAELADVRVREARLDGKIDMVATQATNGINCVSNALAALTNTVNSVTKVVIPNTSVCPGWGSVTITPATTTTSAT